MTKDTSGRVPVSVEVLVLSEHAGRLLPAYRRVLRRFEPDVAGGFSPPTAV